MATENKPEVWLRGPLPEIPPLLQPAAHALLQAQEEVNALMNDFPDKLLWEKPANMASVGFHLQHLRGVLDRLLTYAENKVLTEEQLDYLQAEGKPAAEITTTELLTAFNKEIEKALHQFKHTNEISLTEYRAVGRGKLPSTQIGLLFHAAEHTMRHLGQLLVTVQVIKSLMKS
ncbi:DinB family protein [Adhaeribacter aquaticus]|uniref:DinB family protein n=1 Tax=Adhaeribacter aquaticus TaxID=299567 RepID=UPI000405387C|nr:DinB family protein [Adhaeribacter aquaticus]